MFKPGFFDFDKRLARIDKNEDPLKKLNQVVERVSVSG